MRLSRPHNLHVVSVDANQCIQQSTFCLVANGQIFVELLGQYGEEQTAQNHFRVMKPQGQRQQAVENLFLVFKSCFFLIVSLNYPKLILGDENPSVEEHGRNIHVSTHCSFSSESGSL